MRMARVTSEIWSLKFLWKLQVAAAVLFRRAAVFQFVKEIMKSSGLTIRLVASPEALHKRLVNSAPQRGRALRPLLGDDAPVEKIRTMLNDREEAYSAASISIETDDQSHDQVAEAIAKAWRSSEVAKSSTNASG